MATACPSCGADIVYVSLRTGKSIAVNLRPLYQVVTNDGRLVTGREPHFVTCPKGGPRVKGEWK